MISEKEMTIDDENNEKEQFVKSNKKSNLPLLSIFVITFGLNLLIA